jgi:serine/threonine-protein kinase SRPK3
MKRLTLRGIKKGQLSIPAPAFALANRFFSGSSPQNVSQPLPSPPRAMREENIFSNYCPGYYHPVRLGDTFKDRYTVIPKIGVRGVLDCLALPGYFVSPSRKRKPNLQRVGQCVALKVLRTDSNKGPNQPDEAELLQFVNATNPQHPGGQHIIQLLDHFIHPGPNGDHSCLVFEPMGESILSL